MTKLTKILLIVSLAAASVSAFYIGLGPIRRETKSVLPPLGSYEYMNRNHLSQAEINAIEDNCDGKYSTASWDADGYLRITMYDDDERTPILVCSYNKHWPECYMANNLVPDNDDWFGKPEDMHEYICYYNAYSGTESDKIYLYINWPRKVAERYSEYIKSVGFTIEPEYDNDFNGLDYMYSARNEEGIIVTVAYGTATDEDMVSNITLTLPKGEII